MLVTYSCTFLLIQVNSQDMDSWSALHVACYYGASELVDILLKRGAHVSGENGPESVWIKPASMSFAC